MTKDNTRSTTNSHLSFATTSYTRSATSIGLLTLGTTFGTYVNNCPNGTYKNYSFSSYVIVMTDNFSAAILYPRKVCEWLW